MFKLRIGTACGGAVAVLLSLVPAAPAAEIELPGEAMTNAPVTCAPFPDRMSAFVWRNWTCVDKARLAEVVGATPEEIVGVAKELGLKPQGRIEPEWKTKGYITVLRRNWHLLDYPQILRLLGTDRKQLLYRLREDDFLFGKFNNIKPRCGELRWDAAEVAKSRPARERLARFLSEEGIDPAPAEEPRFAFIRELSSVPSGEAAPASASAFDRKMMFSYFADYADPLMDDEIASFPEGLLARYAADGVNAVYLHVVLRTLAKDPFFTEFGEGAERRQANLRKLVARAAKYGIKVFLYLNEPRPMPCAFFDGKYEKCRGTLSWDHLVNAMCIRSPEVRRWVRSATASVFRAAPGLGGVFIISASENLVHCQAHGGKRIYENDRTGWCRPEKFCKTCEKLTFAESVADDCRLLIDGMHDADPNALAIVWDWGWGNYSETGDDVSAVRSIASLLPKENVKFMTMSERGKVCDFMGTKTSVNEYSLSQVGPADIARGKWRAAQDAGLRTMAKAQVSSSWEMVIVPYVPVMDNVAKHAFNLMRLGVDSALESWSCGCYPSPNLEIFNSVRTTDASYEDVLDRVAVKHYGVRAAPRARKAWSVLSSAYSEYPFYNTTLHRAPHHWGPANPLYAEPTGYEATMTGIPYDDLKTWRSVFPAETYIAQCQKVADGFDRGSALWREVVAATEGAARAQAVREYGIIRTVALHMASCADQARFVQARDRGDRAEMRRIAERELARAKELLPIVGSDSRIGYECSCHYFYLPQDLREKILNCREILATLPSDDSFTFATWNIGHFSCGRKGASDIPPEKASAMVGRYRDFIARTGADVIGLCEYSDEIASNGTVSAEETVFRGWDGCRSPKDTICNVLRWRRGELLKDGRVDYNKRYYGHYYRWARLKIMGREVCFVETHLDWDIYRKGQEGNRDSQIRQLVEAFKDEPYVVIAGDFNTSVRGADGAWRDAPEEFRPFREAGFSAAHWGRLKTWPSSQPRQSIDNVFVKGLDVSEATVWTDAELSDHCLLSCRLSFPALRLAETDVVWNPATGADSAGRRWTRDALADLTNVIARVTGRVPHVFVEGQESGAAASRIYFGNTRAAAEAGCVGAELRRGDWRILSRPGRVYLFAVGGIGASGAMTDFAERFCGYWFLTPDGDDPYVADAAKTVPCADVTVRPAIYKRDVYTARWGEWMNFARRRRAIVLDSELENEYRLSYNVKDANGVIRLCHSSYCYLPPEKHFKEHPEWYSQMDGARRAYPSGQICMSNPEARQKCLEKLLEFIEKDRREFPDGDHPTVYDFTQQDGGTRLCECEACMRTVARYNRVPGGRREGGDAGLQLEFINWIATEAAKRYPDVQLRTFAYVSTGEAPDPRLIVPAPNVNIWWCDVYTKSDHTVPLTTPGHFNGAQAWELADWSRITTNLTVWDYMLYGGIEGTDDCPEWSPDAIRADLRFFRDHGVTRMSSESELQNPEQPFYWLNYYLYSSFFVNPDADLDALVSDYCRVYGEGAAKMREALELLRRAELASPAKDPRGLMARIQGWRTPEMWERFRTLAEGAYAAAKRPAERARIARVLSSTARELIRLNLNRRGGAADLARAKEDYLRYGCEWSARAPLRSAQEREELAKGLETALDILDIRFRDMPKELAGAPQSEVKCLDHHYFGTGNPNARKVRDPASETGWSYVWKPGDPDAAHAHDPIACGVYDFATKQSFCFTFTRTSADFSDERFHWVRLGRIRVGSNAVLWIPADWQMGFNLKSFHINCDGAEEDPNWYEAWLSVKMTGPAYVKGSKSPNALGIDRMVLRSVKEK